MELGAREIGRSTNGGPWIRMKLVEDGFNRQVQRFANVAIFPKPNRRSSAVTRVKPSTPAVAAKKRSAGSW